MALLSQLSHRHQDLSKCLHLNLHFPSRSSWHYQPCWQKNIWMLWLRFSILSYSAHSGRAVQVTTMRLMYIFSHCIAAKVKVVALLLKLPSLPAGTWTVFFLSAYSIQKPFLLYITLISLCNSRHYMLPATVLCQCFPSTAFCTLLLPPYFLFFPFSLHLFLAIQLSITYISLILHISHIYHDSFDPGSNFCLLSCLCSRLLCPPLSEIALIFLLERFHLTTAAAVVLFLLFIFLDLNSFDAQEPFILHISLCLSKIVPWSPFASLSDGFLFPIENITLPVSEEQFVCFPMVQFCSSWWTLIRLFSK